jgi:hypothetical protein
MLPLHQGSRKFIAKQRVVHFHPQSVLSQQMREAALGDELVKFGPFHLTVS